MQAVAERAVSRVEKSSEVSGVQRVYWLLGLAQAGGVAGAILTLLKTESVQLTILVAVGAGVVGLMRWALGRLIQIASDKVDQWEKNFISMGETLDDVPRRADFKELDAKVDELALWAEKAGQRLDDHSGRIHGVEEDQKRLITRALGLIVNRLVSDEQADPRKKLEE